MKFCNPWTVLLGFRKMAAKSSDKNSASRLPTSFLSKPDGKTPLMTTILF